MRVLFLGDVMGRAGRQAIVQTLPRLRTDWRADFIIVNAENTTHGRGLSAAHAAELLDAGADVLTLGDHAFDQREMLTFIQKEPRILRPLNLAKNAPGRGVGVFSTGSGRKVLVTQALGQVFMKQPFADPFAALDEALRTAPIGAATVIVDFHAEATSEKMAMGHWLDGRASLVVGTHTHVPTADAQILPGGTAFQSDAGMCGDYNSVIGMDKAEPLRRFLSGMAREPFTPAKGEASLCGVFVKTADKTGLAERIVPVRVGGQLAEAVVD